MTGFLPFVLPGGCGVASKVIFILLDNTHTASFQPIHFITFVCCNQNSVVSASDPSEADSIERLDKFETNIAYTHNKFSG